MRCKQCGKEFIPEITTIRPDGSINVAGKEFCSFDCCNEWVKHHGGWSADTTFHLKAHHNFNVKKGIPANLAKWRNAVNSIIFYMGRHDLTQKQFGVIVGLSTKSINKICSYNYIPETTSGKSYRIIMGFYESGRYKE